MVVRSLGSPFGASRSHPPPNVSFGVPVSSPPYAKLVSSWGPDIGLSPRPFARPSSLASGFRQLIGEGRPEAGPASGGGGGAVVALARGAVGVSE